MKKISIITLGCKTNQFESEAILDKFIKNGYILAELEDNPQIIIINTCCVTNRAEYKSRYAIRKALEHVSSNGKVIVTGCYVNRGSTYFEKIEERVVLFKNYQKHKIFDKITGNQNESEFIEFSADKYHLHTRVPVKVQDGCNFFCSYCILPYVRGKPVSRSRESILTQVQNLAENGVKEIILTGINLGLYGLDLKVYSLIDLLKDLVETDISQIRLSSLEPMFFTDEIIDFFASYDKICPHFHIPLQSGSDTVLKRMNRTYSVKDFAKIVHKVQTKIFDAAIGCDVIVGFPNESNEEFMETRKFIEKLPITYLHVFRYSPRPHTAGIKKNINIHGSVSKKRMQSLQKLGIHKKNEYMKFLVKNKIPLNVVLETTQRGYWSGVSNHFVRVFLKNETAENGVIKRVIASEYSPSLDGLIAEEV